MSNLKKKIKSGIDAAADTAKKAVDVVSDTTKDVAHASGRKMAVGAKKLKNV